MMMMMMMMAVMMMMTMMMTTMMMTMMMMSKAGAGGCGRLCIPVCRPDPPTGKAASRSLGEEEEEKW